MIFEKRSAPRLRAVLSNTRVKSAALAVLLALGGVFLSSGTESALAQATNFTASKKLCAGEPTGNAPSTCVTAPTVQAGQPVYYVITVTSLAPTAQTVSISDNYPSGFLDGAVVCKIGSTTVTLSNTSSPLGNLSLPAGATVICTVQGYFTQNAGNSLPAQVNTANIAMGGQTASPSVTTSVSSNPQISNDLSITKSVSPTLVGEGSAYPLPAIVTYTIQIHNAGPAVNLGHWFTLHDNLALLPNGIPLNATLVAGSATCTVLPVSPASDCLDPAGPVPAGGSPMVPTMADDPLWSWKFAPGSLGHLASGATMTITYQVKIDKVADLICVKEFHADGLKNKAFFTLTNNDGSALTDQNAANNTATGPASDLHVETGNIVQDPDCGAPGQLTVTKKQIQPNPANLVPWSPPAGAGTVTYEITIKNTSSSPGQTITIPGGKIEDIVIEGLGTPPFKRSFAGFTFVGGVPLSGIQQPGSGQHTYSYYLENNLGWKSTTSLTLAPNQQTKFRVKFDYAQPNCDTVPNVNPKPIYNKIKVTYNAVPVGGGAPVTFVQSSLVATKMKPQQPCKFLVKKVLVSGGPKVKFGGAPLVYKVSFRNNDAPRKITVLDRVRITKPSYATAVPFQATYSCTASAGVTNAPTSGSVTSGTANHHVSPAQGSPVIPNTYTFFPTNGQVTCTVTVKVKRPAFNNANCTAETAYFENLALMDITNPYNPNSPWAPSGFYNTGNISNPSPQNKNWATVKTELPKCFDAIINKSASVNGLSPAWTGASGPNVNFTVTVTNTGDSALTGSGNFDGLVVKDTLSSGAAYTGFGTGKSYGTPMCALLSSPGTSNGWCQPLPPGVPTTANPINMGVANLSSGGAGQSGNWNIRVHSPFTVTKTIKNCATLMPSGSYAGPDWYSNYNPANPPTACAEVPVLKTQPLKIVKKVQNLTPAALAPLPFTFNVTCTPYPLPPPASLTLTTNNTASGMINNVPSVDTCAISEIQPPIPADVIKACGGPAVWDKPGYSGAGVSTTTAGANIAMSAGGFVTVTNRLRCVTPPKKSLTIIKKIVNDANIPPPNVNFTVTVNCVPGGPNQTVILNSANNYQQTVTGISNSGSCTVTEQPPPVPANLAALGCSWQIPTTGGDKKKSAGIKASPNPGGKTMTATVVNHWVCKPGTGTNLGSLTVIKRIVTDANIPPPNVPFTVNVACVPGGPNTTVTLTSANNYQQVVNGVSNSGSCTVTEQPPPVPPNLARLGCYWEIQKPGGDKKIRAARTAGGKNQTATITNRWVCKDGASTTGSLTIVKKIVNDANIPPPVVPFVVDVVCVPVGPNTTVTLNSANNYQQVVNGVSASGSCTVTERPPQVPANLARLGCHWETDRPSMTKPKSGRGTLTATVTNRWICKPGSGGGTGTGTDTGPTGSMRIIKRIVNDANIPPPVVPFIVNVQCTPNGPNTTVTLNIGNSYTQTVSNIPAGSTCTTTEQPPQVPANLARLGCYWETVTPRTTLPTGTSSVRTITNRWVCKEGAGGGVTPGLPTTPNSGAPDRRPDFPFDRNREDRNPGRAMPNRDRP